MSQMMSQRKKHCRYPGLSLTMGKVENEVCESKRRDYWRTIKIPSGKTRLVCVLSIAEPLESETPDVHRVLIPNSAIVEEQSHHHGEV
jgi:hypothetical protein